jgi:hypothetical protein
MKAINFLWHVGLLAVIAVVGLVIYFVTGTFNVAANEELPPFVTQALEGIRTRSIAHHAAAQLPSSLNDPKMVAAGAWSYSQRGCWQCHGAPGVKPAAFSAGLDPRPSDLRNVVGDMPPQELFFVIRNGLRMSSMAAYIESQMYDPETWKVVAFLKKLPAVSPADYKTWAAAPPADNP